MHQAPVVMRKLKYFLSHPYPPDELRNWEWTGPFLDAPSADIPLLTKVGTDLDGLLPFPRKAPSVLHATNNEGLSSRPFGRALLWSAVSF